MCASNLAIHPSRTEGFGLTALEALSVGLLFLVGQNSGFAEAIQEIPGGRSFVVGSEEPEHWAEAIKGVRQKGSEKARQECQELRTRYAKKYNLTGRHSVTTLWRLCLLWLTVSIPAR